MNNQLFDSSIVRSHELYVSSDSRNDAISGVDLGLGEARGLEATRGRDRKREAEEGGREERKVGCAHLHLCPRRCTDKRGGCRACARRRPLVVGPRPQRPNRKRHVPQSAHEARCAAAAAGSRTVGRPSSTRPATAPNLGTKSHGKSRYTRPLPRLSPGARR